VEAYHDHAAVKREYLDRVAAERFERQTMAEILVFLKLFVLYPGRRLLRGPRLRVMTALVAEMERMGPRLKPDMALDISQRRAAELANVRPQTAQRALDGLIRDGWLVLLHPGDRRRARRVAPNLQRLSEACHTTSLLLEENQKLNEASPEGSSEDLEVVWNAAVSSLSEDRFADACAAVRGDDGVLERVGGIGESARRVDLTLRQRGELMTTDDLAKATGLHPQTIGRVMERLGDAVKRVGDRYKTVKKSAYRAKNKAKGAKRVAAIRAKNALDRIRYLPVRRRIEEAAEFDSWAEQSMRERWARRAALSPS